MRTREILMMMLASAFGFAGSAVYSRVHTVHTDDAQVLRGLLMGGRRARRHVGCVEFLEDFLGLLIYLRV